MQKGTTLLEAQLLYDYIDATHVTFSFVDYISRLIGGRVLILKDFRVFNRAFVDVVILVYNLKQHS